MVFINDNNDGQVFQMQPVYKVLIDKPNLLEIV